MVIYNVIIYKAIISLIFNCVNIWFSFINLSFMIKKKKKEKKSIAWLKKF